MRRVISLLGIAQPAQYLIQDLLEIRLAHVDHIDHSFRVTKAFGIGFLAWCNIVFFYTRGPERAAIILLTPGNKAEPLSYSGIVRQDEFPAPLGEMLSHARCCTSFPHHG